MSDLSLARELDGAASPALLTVEEGIWVQCARDGDLEAFDAIMTRYEPRLLRFLIGLVGDVEVARELCQDTFLAAYQALPRLQGELHLSAWLHTIALNRARSHHRRRRLRWFLPLDDSYHHPDTANLEDAVVTQDLVRRVLDRLPEKYAHPLVLQSAGGLSCREIGAVLNCSEGAVKVRLLRAREAFRRIYDEQEHPACTS